MASFTDLVKAQKAAGSGNVGALASVSGKKVLEKIDPRNYLFNRSGLLATLMPGLKGYQAKVDPAKIAKDVSAQKEIGGQQLSDISAKITIVAKNSMVLPVLARDMNVMKQGIIKLVKLQGGTQRDKADRFFMTAKERESSYEAQFKKTPSIAPTKVGEEEKKKGFFESLVEFIPGILKTLLVGGLIAAVIGKLAESPEIKQIMKDFLSPLISGFFDAMAKGFGFIGELFQDEKVQESVRNAVSSFFGMIGDFLNIKLFDFLGQDVSIGGALGLVVASLVGFKLAVAAATAALTRMTLGGAGGAAAGAAAAGGLGQKILKVVKKVGPLALIAGALYYIDEKTGEATPAPAGTPVPPGTPELSQKDIETTVPSPTTKQQENVSDLTDTQRKIGSAAVAATGGVVAYQAAKTIKDLPGLASKTGQAVLDVRTQSVGQLAKSTPTTKWGRFLAFVAQKSPKLWGKIGLKLAQTATLMTIPIGGWIVAAINLGFSVYAAYELYQLWKEFNGQDTEESKDASSQQTTSEVTISPEEVSSATSVPAAPVVSPTPSVATGVPSQGSYSAAAPAPAGPSETTTGQSTTPSKAPRDGAQGSIRKKTDGIIFHHTGGRSVQGAIATLQQKGFGYNYIIDRDGTVIPYINDNAVAYHAGDTKKVNYKYTNGNTIGIATVASDDNDVTPEQVKAGVNLSKQLSQKYGFPLSNVFGHGEVSSSKMPTEGKTLVAAVKSGTVPTEEIKTATAPTTAKPSLDASGRATAESDPRVAAAGLKADKRSAQEQVPGRTFFEEVGDFFKKGDPSALQPLLGNYVVDRGSILRRNTTDLSSEMRSISNPGTTIISPTSVRTTPPSQGAAPSNLPMANVVDTDFTKMLFDKTMWGSPTKA